MLSTTTTPTTASNSEPKFEFQRKASQDPRGSGGLFYVCINGAKVCEAEHWAFTSCGVATLFNFKAYSYLQPHIAKPGGGYYSNWDYLEAYHDQLFTWIETAKMSDMYLPKEFLMALSNMQVGMLPKMLKHPKIKLVDRFLNKSHGPSHINIYRLSCLMDFKHQ